MRKQKYGFSREDQDAFAAESVIDPASCRLTEVAVWTSEHHFVAIRVQDQGMLVGIDEVELQKHHAIANDLLVLLAAMAALRLENPLVGAASRLDVTDRDHWLSPHRMALPLLAADPTSRDRCV